MGSDPVNLLSHKCVYEVEALGACWLRGATKTIGIGISVGLYDDAAAAADDDDDDDDDDDRINYRLYIYICR